MREGFFDRRTPPCQALVACGLRLYEQGFTAACSGNLSLRFTDKELWATPTGVSKCGSNSAGALPKNLDIKGLLP